MDAEKVLEELEKIGALSTGTESAVEREVPSVRVRNLHIERAVPSAEIRDDRGPEMVRLLERGISKLEQLTSIFHEIKDMWSADRSERENVSNLEGAERETDIEPESPAVAVQTPSDILQLQDDPRYEKARKLALAKIRGEIVTKPPVQQEEEPDILMGTAASFSADQINESEVIVVRRGVENNAQV